MGYLDHFGFGEFGVLVYVEFEDFVEDVVVVFVE